jgi:hypothetical protein
MLSADEAASMAALCPSSLQQQEQLLLDSLVGLLLQGRYFPLSAQEWAVAQRHEFTFGEQPAARELNGKALFWYQQWQCSMKTWAGQTGWGTQRWACHEAAAHSSSSGRSSSSSSSV